MTQAILCILDGWGWRDERTDNAVLLADTPNFDRLMAQSPHAFLKACGEDVGLPQGQIGNSEVGHTNIGAGRIVYQELPRINKAIAGNELKQNPALQHFISVLKLNKKAAHVMGLISPGGVHAHQDHAVALVKELSNAGIPVCIHAFLDGRDVPPKSAYDQMQKFLQDIKPFSNARMATVTGRYYAMDRDKRWERVEKAYNAIVDATGDKKEYPLSAIQNSYDQNITDEFILPAIMPGFNGIQNDDGLIFTNFRADRARQLLNALLDLSFDGFHRKRTARFSSALGMAPYSDHLNLLMATLFPQTDLSNTLGEVVSYAGRAQLRAAETEKYPHVTYFLNGGVEVPLNGEDRLMVPSPKVATYDLQPEMSANELTDQLLTAMQTKDYALVVVNYANPDMVGHTGILSAAIKAVETVDHCLGRLMDYAKDKGAALLVTADHGNCETMRDPVTHGPHTAHTLSLVPVALYNAPSVTSLHDGRLSDLAPTLLSLLNLEKPEAMTGQNLIR